MITSDNKPYGLHRARNEEFFKGEKIISLRKNHQPCFTYTDFDCYVTQTFYSIKPHTFNLKYLTALLNSKLIAFWLRYKGKMQGNNYQIDKEPLVNIPIINTPEKTVNLLSNMVAEILDKKSKNEDTLHLEQEIDNIIYRLYNLTYDNVKIIDDKFPLSQQEYESIAI
nr:TaqI-like C-terminal specificity domain-containing protein [Flavobacterium sp. CS20]